MKRVRLPTLDRLTVKLALGITLLVILPLGLAFYLLAESHFNHTLAARRTAAELENRILAAALRHQMLDRDGRLMTEILQDVVADSDAEQSADVTATTPLVGEGAAITSLSLVSFITGVELEIEEKYDVELTLVSEEALSRNESPFRTIDALSDYVLTLVGVLDEA